MIGNANRAFFVFSLITIRLRRTEREMVICITIYYINAESIEAFDLNLFVEFEIRYLYILLLR